MMPQTIVYWTTLILAMLLAVILHRALRAALRGLLEDVITLPAGTQFFLRAFAIVVFLAALAAAVSSRSDLKDGARVMEYVWAIGAGVKDILENLFIVLLVFLGLVVVLTAALRRKH